MAFDYNNYMLSQGALNSQQGGMLGGGIFGAIAGAFGIHGQNTQGLLADTQGFTDKKIINWGAPHAKPNMIENLFASIAKDLNIGQIGPASPADFSSISAPMATPGMGDGQDIGLVG